MTAITDGQDEKDFKNTGKSGLPDVEQAEVTHYAYDPQTYEVLCRPGQRLSQKKAQRLQELNLYEHVVMFAE
jgi:hypothetical protein